jgi:hypothetical protein
VLDLFAGGRGNKQVSGDAAAGAARLHGGEQGVKGVLCYAVAVL